MGLWLDCEDGGTVTCQTGSGMPGKEEAVCGLGLSRWKERIASREMDRPQ